MNLNPNGISREKLEPLPGVMSMVNCVCFQYSNWFSCMKKEQPAISPIRTSLPPILNSPFTKHMGCEPSQHPPLWWNMSSPFFSLS